jgi:hypothetical protein
VRRFLSALVGAALVMSMTAGAATAHSSGVVTLTINTPPGTFVATGAVPCKSGTTADINDQFLGGDKFIHLIVWKQFTCDHSNATFVLKFDVYLPQPFMGAGSHDYGTWVVDSSSNGSLHGSGVFVGTYYGSDPSALGIVDRLVGVMRR